MPSRPYLRRRSSLYIHQTTTITCVFALKESCILYEFYIKPQPGGLKRTVCGVFMPFLQYKKQSVFSQEVGLMQFFPVSKNKFIKIIPVVAEYLPFSPLLCPKSSEYLHTVCLLHSVCRLALPTVWPFLLF